MTQKTPFINIKIILTCLICVSFVLISNTSLAKRKKRNTFKVSKENLLILSTTKNNNSYGCDTSKKRVKVGKIISSEEDIYKLKKFKRKKKKGSKKAKVSKLEKLLLQECKEKLSTTPSLPPEEEKAGDNSGGSQDKEEDNNSDTENKNENTDKNSKYSIFSSPFKGIFNTSNYFDHDLPFQFKDTNGFQVTSKDERFIGIDGHSGYDWRMPEGTELLAVGSGTIVLAGPETPFKCPILDNKLVSGISVRIEHRVGDEEVFFSGYAHLSEVFVKVGDEVTAGQVIGLSGDTGCSTTPHLHFSIRRFPKTNDGSRTLIDPFGWRASRTDPWVAHPEGAESPYMWKDNSHPYLFSWSEYKISETNNAPVVISKVQFMGEDDSNNLNNEFIQIELDPKLVTTEDYDLTGFTLTNQVDSTTYKFPDNFKIAVNQKVKIYSGSGQDTENTLYWNRQLPAYENTGGCAQILKPSGNNMFRFSYRRGSCTSNISTLNFNSGDEYREILKPLHGN